MKKLMNSRFSKNVLGPSIFIVIMFLAILDGVQEDVTSTIKYIILYATTVFLISFLILFGKETIKFFIIQKANR